MPRAETSSARWMQTQIDIMMDMNWVARHDLFDRLYRRYPHGCRQIENQLSPDVLLTGKNTCVKRKSTAPIKLHNTAELFRDHRRWAQAVRRQHEHIRAQERLQHQLLHPPDQPRDHPIDARQRLIIEFAVRRDA